MAKYSREQIIKMGKDGGYKPSDINYTLKKYGYAPDYNPILDKDNWKNIPSNLASNARAMARDVRTMGGYVLQPITKADRAAHNTDGSFNDKLSAAKSAFMKAVNDDKYRKTLGGMVAGGAVGAFVPKLGIVGGALTGAGIGMAGGPKEFANAILHPYNMELGKQPDVGDVVQGIFNNPLYAALDTAPIYGKPLVKGIEAGLEHAPLAIKQVFPDKKMRAFNRQISNSMLTAKTKGSKYQQGFMDLEASSGIDRKRLVKNILTNDTTNMTDKELILADVIKNNLRDMENEFISKGYGDASEFKDNAKAQYAMYMLGDDNQLVHDDIYRIIRGEDLRTGNSMPSNNTVNKIKSLANEADKLYDENKIAWLSQKLAPITDETGNVVARNLVGDATNYFDTNRIIGKQSVDKLASVFDRTIKEQVEQLGQYIDVENTISDLVKNFENQPLGILKAGEKIPEGKAAFSTKAFRDYIKKKGPNVDIGEALSGANVAEEGAFILDHLYLDMINNAFNKTKGTSNRRLLNAFKKAVLANPHWIMLNRIGNFTNNLMDGVTLLDYKDAIKANKTGLIPEELQYQTSFGSYIHADDVQGITSVSSGLGKSINIPVNRLKQSYSKFKNSKKSLGDIGEFTGQVFANTSDVSANPWYKLEASLEYADRSANLVSQAKRYGAKHGMDWKDVLKKAKSDSKLFSELNTNVNKALGDYVGRNYAMSPGWYNKLSEAVPFYRFITQTGRTTAHQLTHNPLGFMANVTAPARVGYGLSNEYYHNYGLDPEQYEGGVPYLEIDDVKNGKLTKSFRTFGFEPLPIAGVLDDIGSIGKGKDLTRLLGPYLSTFPDVYRFKKYGRTATSPRLTKKRLEGDYTGTRNYEPTLGEIGAYGLNTLLQTVYHPYRITSKEGKEAVNALMGTGMHTAYDTNAWHENPETFKKTLPAELVGRWFGLQSKSVGQYKKEKPSDSLSRNTKKKIERNKSRK
jgi:hypothetical protein